MNQTQGTRLRVRADHRGAVASPSWPWSAGRWWIHKAELKESPNPLAYTIIPTFPFHPPSLLSTHYPKVKSPQLILCWGISPPILATSQVGSFPSSSNHLPWDAATSFNHHNEISIGFQKSPHVNHQTLLSQQRSKSATPNASSYREVGIW